MGFVPRTVRLESGESTTLPRQARLLSRIACRFRAAGSTRTITTATNLPVRARRPGLRVASGRWNRGLNKGGLNKDDHDSHDSALKWLSHPRGGLTKDYHDGSDTASECVSHPGGGLKKDFHDGHDAASDCVTHPVGGLTKDYHWYDGSDTTTPSAAAVPVCVLQGLPQ